MEAHIEYEGDWKRSHSAAKWRVIFLKIEVQPVQCAGCGINLNGHFISSPDTLWLGIWAVKWAVYGTMNICILAIQAVVLQCQGGRRTERIWALLSTLASAAEIWHNINVTRIRVKRQGWLGGGGCGGCGGVGGVGLCYSRPNTRQQLRQATMHRTPLLLKCATRLRSQQGSESDYGNNKTYYVVRSVRSLW